MSTTLNEAIEKVQNSKINFVKFLSANDTKSTRSHQCGIYIPQNAFSILFPQKGLKGENLKRKVNINWMNNITTKSAFNYYGKKTRNEYRITAFGRNFPFLNTEYTGALFILSKIDDENYYAYVLNTEEDIESFLETFNLTQGETNKLLNKARLDVHPIVTKAFQDYINSLNVDFPGTAEMSDTARAIYKHSIGKVNDEILNPDETIVNWYEMEAKLFFTLEEVRFGDQIFKGFKSFDSFIDIAKRILNRRKSRAGHSLENHLKAIFEANNLNFSTQKVTENNKKPDFIFPSIEDYHNPKFPEDKLILLAVKTSCKDRWRQILNEGDRVKNRTKYLFTLQPGITINQFNEMKSEKVQLIVPDKYLSYYDKEIRNEIWSLKDFILMVKNMEKSLESSNDNKNNA